MKGLELVLAPQEGVVLFTVEPADAELLVDEPLWESPGRAQAARRRTRDRNPQRGPRHLSHTHAAATGFPQQVKVTLKRREAAPAARASVGLIRAKNGYEMKRVGPGAFTMGASRREQGRRSNETLKQVRLSRPFYIGNREVTKPRV